MLVDEHGVPLSIVVTGANRHDVTQIEAVLDGRLMEAPEGVEEHCCADKGYDSKAAREAIEKRGMIPHVLRRGEEMDKKQHDPSHRNRRWIVEVSHSWLNRFRKILTRFEKLAVTHEGLIHLAAAIICFRKIPHAQNIIYG